MQPAARTTRREIYVCRCGKVHSRGWPRDGRCRGCGERGGLELVGSRMAGETNGHSTNGKPR